MRRSWSLLAILLVVLVVPAQAQDASQNVLDFMTANPDDIGVLCYTAAEPLAVTEHNADKPFVLASTGKLTVLAEMAGQIEAGLIDPNEEVPLADVAAYWLPGRDGGAHEAWLATLPEGAETVTLAQIADAMITYSSNAAPDYLLSRLGTEGFPELFERLGLENTDPFIPILGLFLAQDNHETGPSESMDDETFAAESQRLMTLYLTDAAWREAEIAYIAKRMAEPTTEEIVAIIEAEGTFWEAHAQKGSARDMLRIMAAAFEEGVFEPAAREFMQQRLNWPMSLNPANADVYDALGSKGGSLAGVLTSAWYAAQKGGDTYLLSVLYNDMPLEIWGDWLSSGAQQMLEIRVFAMGEGCDVFEDALGE